MAAALLALAACGSEEEAPDRVTSTTTGTTTSTVASSTAASTSTVPPKELDPSAASSAVTASSIATAVERYITGCQSGLGPVETYWSDGTVTGYSAHCQAVADETLREEREANTPVCDGTVCRYPSGVSFPDPNAVPTVDVPYT